MALFFHTAALALTAAMGWLYVRGVKGGLFWTIWWYDLALHVLGGLVIGLWACAVALRHGFSGKQTFWWVAGLSFAVTGAWEAFEYILDIQGDPSDTALDLALGIGSAFAVWAGYALWRRISR